MKSLPLLLGTLLAAVLPLAAGPIGATDVDGRAVALDAPGAVTVVISSSPETQDKTRDAGRVIDRLRGKTGLRLVIVVDLRGSFAGLAKGYVGRRMQRDLDTEAARLRPFYRANGNTADPRPEMEGFADFDGALSKKLGWKETPEKLRAVVFGKDGKVAARWDDLADYRELDRAVEKALEGQAAAGPASAP